MFAPTWRPCAVRVILVLDCARRPPSADGGDARRRRPRRRRPGRSTRPARRRRCRRRPRRPARLGEIGVAGTMPRPATTTSASIVAALGLDAEAASSLRRCSATLAREHVDALRAVVLVHVRRASSAGRAAPRSLPPERRSSTSAPVHGQRGGDLRADEASADDYSARPRAASAARCGSRPACGSRSTPSVPGLDPARASSGREQQPLVGVRLSASSVAVRASRSSETILRPGSRSTLSSVGHARSSPPAFPSRGLSSSGGPYGGLRGSSPKSPIEPSWSWSRIPLHAASPVIPRRRSGTESRHRA